MRINPVSSNNYTQNRNFSKNNNPSFGQITNVKELSAIIEKEVEKGKVSRTVADEDIQGLKNVKFNMVEAIEKYFMDTWFFRGEREKFRSNVEKFYYPALKENGLDCNDLPFELKYRLFDMSKKEDYKVYKNLAECQKERFKGEKFLYKFILKRCFNNFEIPMHDYTNKFEMWSDAIDKDKYVASLIGAPSEGFTVTETLQSMIDRERLDEFFYDCYAEEVCDNVIPHDYFMSEEEEAKHINAGKSPFPGPL